MKPRVALPGLLLLLAATLPAAPLTDPLRPSRASLVSGVAGGERPRLQAVIGDGSARVAIVSGQLLRIGDRIGRYQITAIDADGIRFVRNGRSGAARVGAALAAD